ACVAASVLGTDKASSVPGTDLRTARAPEACGMQHDFVLASMTAQRTRERLDSAARYRLARRAVAKRRRRLTPLSQPSHESSLAGVLEAVAAHDEQPDGQGDRGIPGAVDNAVKVGVGD